MVTLVVTTLFHSSCFQSVQTPHIIHQGTPTRAKETLLEQNSHSSQGRAQCEHLHAWNQSIFNDKLHLLADGKVKCHFFRKKKPFSETTFKSPSNGLEEGNGAITQLLLDPESIFVPGNSCNIIINPSTPASVHKQPASNRGSVTF